jgi:hypothetical protein
MSGEKSCPKDTILRHNQTRMRVVSDTQIAYYGESTCQGRTKKGVACTRKAYYLHSETRLCGFHCKKEHRTKLPARPAAEKAAIRAAEITRHQATVDAAALANRQAKKGGSLSLVPMFMMKNPLVRDGWLNVYPNYKDGGRKTGLGLPSLSPKSIGPVHHGQPGLPPGSDLENVHQHNKVFPAEVDSDGNPSPLFYENRLKGYLDPVPHRHKSTAVAIGGKGTSKNVPLYSIWVDKSGAEVRLTYVQSRQIYSHFYELAVLADPQFARLKELLRNGTNLAICGYDACEIELSPAGIEAAYLDPSKPFGHEKCLAALLVLEAKDYPWRKHQTISF